MSAQARSQLLRASRRRPCPICGKPDWCSISADGDIAVCMRKRSDHPARNGGWTHILSTGAYSPPVRPQPTQRQTTPVAERAEIERRHTIYTALLDALDLSEAHRADLLRRGLSQAEITRLHYKSTSSSGAATQIAGALAQRFALHGVPGFYFPHRDWRMVWLPPGYFVPYRDEQGRIAGLQIRRWPYDGDDKYLWLSSKDRPLGASSGAPVHFARPDLLASAEEVIITEGALKADVATYLAQTPVIGVAGVSNFGADFAPRLRDAFPRVRCTVLAYDRDLIEKPHVYQALMRLTAQLERALFQVRVRTWPAPHKGYDDFLLSQLVRRGRAA